MGSVEPALAFVRAEFTFKRDPADLNFDPSGSDAHDLAGRASSFKARGTAVMAPAETVNLSGLMGADGELHSAGNEQFST